MNYKDKLKGYRPEVDADAWNAMQSLLDQQTIVNEEPDEKKTIFGWLKKYLLLVILVLFTMVAVTNFWGGTEHAVSLSNLTDTQTESTLASNESEEDALPQQDVSIDNQNLKGENNELTTAPSERKLFSSADEIKVENNSNLPANNTTNIENRNNETTNLSSTALRSDGEDKLTEKANTINENLGIIENDENETPYEQSNEGGDGMSDIEKSRRDISDSKSELYEPISKIADDKLIQNNKPAFEGSIPKNNTLLKDESVRMLISVDLLTEMSLSPLEKQAAELGEPEFVKPLRKPSRFMIGIDAGSATYFDFVSGESFSLFGIYEIYPWWRAGMRLNHTSMRDQSEYVLNPEIKRRRAETSLILYTQIVPIRLWRFNVGIEGGYGLNDVSDKYRRLRNPEPNVIFAEEEVQNSSFDGIHAGVFITFEMNTYWSVGASVTSSIMSEAVQYSGRMTYRF